MTLKTLAAWQEKASESCIESKQFSHAARNFDFIALCDEMERMRKALVKIDAHVFTANDLGLPINAKKILMLTREALGGKDE